MSNSNDTLKPKDHAERVAHFRMSVLGSLTCAQLNHGDQAAMMRELSKRRVRPPNSACTRTYSVSTLERWLKRYREGGVEALRPGSRATGHAQALTDEQRELIVEIRREHRGASVPLIIKTLEAEGRLERGLIKQATLRRLLVQHGLGRQTRGHRGTSDRERRRWQVARPGQLWHADVCHGPTLVDANGRKTPLRIHGFLDDASRFVPKLAVRSTEREVDMLELLVEVLRVFGRPDTLYLDNGSTYRGEILATACARLNITLLHAKPYDPQARGKMERFWRTLREGCLDYVGENATLHEVQVKLLAFLDRHYHHSAHSSLLGRSPAKVWAEREREVIGEDELERALTVRTERKIRTDGTLSVGGQDWELADGWLAGAKLTVARSFVNLQRPPWVEHEDKQLPLRLVDPVANSTRKRKPSKRTRKGIDAVDFDPNRVRVDGMLGRRPGGGGR
jgi:transposase InsO family protein